MASAIRPLTALRRGATRLPTPRVASVLQSPRCCSSSTSVLHNLPDDRPYAQQFALDSLSMSHKLKAAGLDAVASEAVTRAVLGSLYEQENRSKREFASKGDMALIGMRQESRFEEHKTLQASNLVSHQVTAGAALGVGGSHA